MIELTELRSKSDLPGSPSSFPMIALEDPHEAELGTCWFEREPSQIRLMDMHLVSLGSLEICPPLSLR